MMDVTAAWSQLETWILAFRGSYVIHKNKIFHTCKCKTILPKKEKYQFFTS